MASLFFSVGIQGVLQLIQQKVRNVVKDQPSATIAYADDNCAMVPPGFTQPEPPSRRNPRGLPRLVNQIIKIFADHDIPVNMDKVQIHSYDPASPWNKDAQGRCLPPDQIGFVCMGMPLGTQHFIDAFANEKLISSCKIIDKEERGSKYLYRQLRGEKQIFRRNVFAILNYCIAARVTYLTRNVRPGLLTDAMTAFDDAMTDCLLNLLDMPLHWRNDKYRTEFDRIRSLPKSLGGLQLGRNTLHGGLKMKMQYNNCISMVKAYVIPHIASSIIGGSCPDAVLLRLSLSNFSVRALEDITEGIPAALTSKSMKNGSFDTSTFYKVEANDLHTHLLHPQAGSNLNRKAEAATLLSGSHPLSGAWLDYHGTSDARLSLNDDTWLSFARMRCLQSPQRYHPGQKPQCPCATAAIPDDMRLWHCLTCKENSGPRIRLHNYIVALLYNNIKRYGKLNDSKGDFICADLVNSAGNSLDPGHLCKIANIAGHRGDPGEMKVDLLIRKDGKTYALDVSIANPAANKYLSKDSHKVAGVAMRERREEKRRKYESLLPESTDFRFLPVVAETTGRLCDEARVILRSLATSGEHSYRKLTTLISCAVARYISVSATTAEKQQLIPLPYDELVDRPLDDRVAEMMEADAPLGDALRFQDRD